MSEVLAAHELTQTFNCRTPHCTGEARAQHGRFAYCTACQIERKTAHPDGTPIIGRPIPDAPGTRSGRKRKTPTNVSSGNRSAGEPAPPRSSNGKVGPYEAKATSLVAAARELDAALEAYKAAKEALEQAREEWVDSLRRFNGKPAAAENGDQPSGPNLSSALERSQVEAAPQFAGLA